jgi:hypothetical protein
MTFSISQSPLPFLAAKASTSQSLNQSKKVEQLALSVVEMDKRLAALEGSRGFGLRRQELAAGEIGAQLSETLGLSLGQGI